MNCWFAYSLYNNWNKPPELPKINKTHQFNDDFILQIPNSWTIDKFSFSDFRNIDLEDSVKIIWNDINDGKIMYKPIYNSFDNPSSGLYVEYRKNIKNAIKIAHHNQKYLTAKQWKKYSIIQIKDYFANTGLRIDFDSEEHA